MTTPELKSAGYDLYEIITHGGRKWTWGAPAGSSPSRHDERKDALAGMLRAYEADLARARALVAAADGVAARTEPDLLAAAKLAVPWVAKIIADETHLQCAIPMAAPKALAALQAAIAKAEGR